MVVRCLLMLFLLPAVLFAQGVVVTAEVEGGGVAGMPIEGSITITRESHQSIDEQSFNIEGKPLSIERLREVQLSPGSNTVITIYNFTLEPQPPGLQVLPEVNVTVGGNIYRSIPSTYHVVEGKGQAGAAGQSATGVVLLLESIVDGEKTLYPGQRITVGYRFGFNFSVDLSQEELPLLSPEGFRKIGGKDTKEFTKDQMNYLEATQVIEALEPGNYQIPAGLIKGRAYRKDRLGRIEYAKTESYAEAESVRFTVLPFPEEGKPPSFNGAIGTALDFEVTLLSANKLAAGDKIELMIKITGNGELATLPMPEVCCQPGFSGFFQMSDLPPLEEVYGSTKTFRVEMRPLTASLKAIPSLEFSYFNPKTKEYTALKSARIPITVEGVPTIPIKEKRLPGIEQKEATIPAEDTVYKPDAIEIEGIYPLKSSDLTNALFGTWWVLLMLPIGIGALLIQIQMRQYLEKQKTIKKQIRSKDLFAQAVQLSPSSTVFFTILEQAFLLRLAEVGAIASAAVSPRDLPKEGKPGRVKAFFHEVDRKRFSGSTAEFDAVFMQEMAALFQELGKAEDKQE